MKTSVFDKLENNCLWYKLENKTLFEELQDYKIKLSKRLQGSVWREGYKIEYKSLLKRGRGKAITKSLSNF